MIIDLKGRKAIVTGSTAGIGRATAERLARAGASVVVSGRGGDRVGMRHMASEVAYVNGDKFRPAVARLLWNCDDLRRYLANNIARS